MVFPAAPFCLPGFGKLLQFVRSIEDTRRFMVGLDFFLYGGRAEQHFFGESFVTT